MREMFFEISEIERMMVPVLDGAQMARLHAVLSHYLLNESDFPSGVASGGDNELMIDDFLAAKTVEGCSKRTICYYSSTLKRFAEAVDMPFPCVSTDDVRNYLAGIQKGGRANNVTVDNVRRVISSLFSWLEAEDYIYKSPLKRIGKIRSMVSVKPTISDESMVELRDGCKHIRDLALVDLLSSTGMRVGELVRLNRADIDFERRECIVYGKGSKERKVYFDAKAKVHLREYLKSREDNEAALFVSLNAPYARLEISGVESRLRKLGRDTGQQRVHPHKFRRTLATNAIDKGMPIEQVQVLLGHSKIDTTLCYAMVDQQNVKQSHHKYIG